MGQVLVRSIDDDVIAGLKVKARLAGVSFETFLRQQLKAIAPLTGDEKVALLEEFHRQHGPLGITTPPEEIIREQREAR
jgi:antitoxin FitA